MMDQRSDAGRVGGGLRGGFCSTNCLHQSNKHQLRNRERQENITHLSLSTMGFVCSTFPTFVPAVLQREPVMGMSARTDSFVSIFVSVADYRVHVLWHHAKQVDAADLSAWLHEEPSGLPSWPPSASVALLQLHVHARWVRTSTLSHVHFRRTGLIDICSACSRCCSVAGRTKCYMWSLNLVFFLCCLRSLEQLGFNALLQLMIGVPLEMVHGILRISLLYMAGVLAGECLIILECSISM